MQVNTHNGFAKLFNQWHECLKKLLRIRGVTEHFNVVVVCASLDIFTFCTETYLNHRAVVLMYFLLTVCLNSFRYKSLLTGSDEKVHNSCFAMWVFPFHEKWWQMDKKLITVILSCPVVNNMSCERTGKPSLGMMLGELNPSLELMIKFWVIINSGVSVDHLSFL